MRACVRGVAVVWVWVVVCIGCVRVVWLWYGCGWLCALVGCVRACVGSVRGFYACWSNFVSRRSYNWHDKWKLPHSPNRLYRRAMEKENKKERGEVCRDPACCLWCAAYGVVCGVLCGVVCGVVCIVYGVAYCVWFIAYCELKEGCMDYGLTYVYVCVGVCLNTRGSAALAWMGCVCVWVGCVCTCGLVRRCPQGVQRVGA